MKNTNKMWNVALYTLLIIIISFGFYIRTAYRSDIIPPNVGAFFYYRTAYLVNEGEYLKTDTEGIYPDSYPENYPPFFMIFTALLYKISFAKNLLAFASYFPVIMYVLISVLGYFVLTRLFGKAAGISFVVLFAIIPDAISLTEKGFYTEEAVGVLLLLGFVYCLARLKDNIKHLYFGAVFLTLFILTWQTFVIIYAGLFFILLLSVKDKELLKRLLILAVVPIFLSYIISVHIIGLAYSPFQIFKETYLSVTADKDLDYRIALGRNNLVPTNLEMFFKNYSYFSTFLLLGFFVSVKNFKEHKYRSLLVMCLFMLFPVFIYLKLRYLALPSVVLMSAIGLQYFYDIGKWDKKIIIGFLIIAPILIAPAVYYKALESREPLCMAEFDYTAENLRINYPSRINMIVKNVGGTPLCDDNYYSSLHAFGGTHVEIENARLLGAKISAQGSQSSTVEENASNGFGWFETKIDCLKPNKAANVSFEILPAQFPVKVYYRCWLPDQCSLPPPEGIRAKYRAQWRNEKCVKRQPTGGEYCKVDVYAGYPNKQKFYCNAESLYNR